jgi:four helix bundle protein
MSFANRLVPRLVMLIRRDCGTIVMLTESGSEGRHEHAKSRAELLRFGRLSEDACRDEEFFEVSKRFPKEEMYSLTDQVRRSSRSVGAQIAEAWAKRRYEKHFVSKLTDADGELQETKHWILSALDAGYLSDDQARSLCTELSEVGCMLNSMMEKADAFCGDRSLELRETAAEYFATTDC